LKTKSIRSLVLFCPAVYTQDAFSIPFDEQFTNAIRQSDSWRAADIVQVLDHFKGNLIIFIGERDEVIPQGVVDMLDSHATSVSHKETITLPNTGHQIIEAAEQSASLMDLIVSKILLVSR